MLQDRLSHKIYHVQSYLSGLIPFNPFDHLSPNSSPHHLPLSQVSHFSFVHLFLTSHLSPTPANSRTAPCVRRRQTVANRASLTTSSRLRYPSKPGSRLPRFAAPASPASDRPTRRLFRRNVQEWSTIGAGGALAVGWWPSPTGTVGLDRAFFEVCIQMVFEEDPGSMHHIRSACSVCSLNLFCSQLLLVSGHVTPVVGTASPPSTSFMLCDCQVESGKRQQVANRLQRFTPAMLQSRHILGFTQGPLVD